MQQNIHKAYVTIELLMAIVILGIGFNLFYKIYQQRIKNNVFNQSPLYQAQELMEEAIISKTNANDFSIESKNGYIYKGVLIQSPTIGITYQYFIPNIILEKTNDNL
ncbi:hypothetical protein [Helicobacter cappadocius]|uniref:Uncharacterized protein n=1 Tax=Helicobacter cappadocius TaxID=3063998 RepID=A0AA90PQH3_9HELI|nr:MULTISPECIES: hypothetical protein [unclassified Helicobacter]MDO7252420.1 hypothetical protein [Helicobacter sp. faydin-H75]MDP2538287.1 hypothetical protein [Helicobacter sp. faydin-H76]